jgi:hypothetical protein
VVEVLNAIWEADFLGPLAPQRFAVRHPSGSPVRECRDLCGVCVVTRIPTAICRDRQFRIQIMVVVESNGTLLQKPGEVMLAAGGG